MCRIRAGGVRSKRDRGISETREVEDESHSNPVASRGSVLNLFCQYDGSWYERPEPDDFGGGRELSMAGRKCK